MAFGQRWVLALLVCLVAAAFARGQEAGVAKEGVPPTARLVAEAERKLAAAEAALEARDPAAATELLEEAAAVLTRSPTDDFALVTAALNRTLELAGRCAANGAKRTVWEWELARRERIEPYDVLHVNAARIDLASQSKAVGRHIEAKQLYERALEELEAEFGLENRAVLVARQNLANTLQELGELDRARALHEWVLAIRERTLPADHEDVLISRLNLANSLDQLGDPEGARAMIERVIGPFERKFGPTHQSVLMSKISLASALQDVEEHAAAARLLEEVLEALEGRLPADHEIVLNARLNLGLSAADLGRPELARDVFAELIEIYEDARPGSRDHTFALLNYASMSARLGDFETSTKIYATALDDPTSRLDENGPDTLLIRLRLACDLYRMGEEEAWVAASAKLVANVLASLERAFTVSPREARSLASRVWMFAAGVLFLTGELPADSEQRAGAFSVIETIRHVANDPTHGQRPVTTAPDWNRLREEAAAVRREVQELALAGRDPDESAESFAGRIQDAVFRRDQLERRMRLWLDENGGLTRPIRVEGVAAGLDDDAIAVAYRRFARWMIDSEVVNWESGEEALLAHVVYPDGRLARVELCDVAEMQAAIRDWRRAIGTPIDSAAQPAHAEAQTRAGQRLRELLLDPVWRTLPRGRSHPKRVHLCLDDSLHLVPVDALPLDDGRRVGDVYEIHHEISLGRLMTKAAPLESSATLLCMGDVEFSAEPLEEESEAPKLRSLVDQAFAPLPETAVEIEQVSRLFREQFGREPELLREDGADKAALLELAPHARYLHLATHGWIASESSRPAGTVRAAVPGRALGPADTLRGLAPMTLCGLALAGANSERDSLGRVRGLLTAEELAGCDLSRCELAVLSACDTNVGVGPQRAGQGVVSMQSALHSAGARTALTSLWKVDDAATRRLMELFYTHLWRERLPKSRALWEAKKTMRSERFPTHDWAGWVLTGDPD